MVLSLEETVFRLKDLKQTLEYVVKVYNSDYNGENQAGASSKVHRKTTLDRVAGGFLDWGVWRTQRQIFGITLQDLDRATKQTESDLAEVRELAVSLTRELKAMRNALAAGNGSSIRPRAKSATG